MRSRCSRTEEIPPIPAACAIVRTHFFPSSLIVTSAPLAAASDPGIAATIKFSRFTTSPAASNVPVQSAPSPSAFALPPFRVSPFGQHDARSFEPYESGRMQYGFDAPLTRITSAEDGVLHV